MSLTIPQNNEEEKVEETVEEKPFNHNEKVATDWHLETVGDGNIKAYNRLSKRTFIGTHKQFEDLFKG